jgi:hypothetical protein
VAHRTSLQYIDTQYVLCIDTQYVLCIDTQYVLCIHEHALNNFRTDSRQHRLWRRHELRNESHHRRRGHPRDRRPRLLRRQVVQEGIQE